MLAEVANPSLRLLKVRLLFSFPFSHHSHFSSSLLPLTRFLDLIGTRRHHDGWWRTASRQGLDLLANRPQYLHPVEMRSRHPLRLFIFPSSEVSPTAHVYHPPHPSNRLRQSATQLDHPHLPACSSTHIPIRFMAYPRSSPCLSYRSSSQRTFLPLLPSSPPFPPFSFPLPKPALSACCIRPPQGSPILLSRACRGDC